MLGDLLHVVPGHFQTRVSQLRLRIFGPAVTLKMGGAGSAEGLAFGATGILYGNDVDGQPQLDRVNTSDGALTPVGPLNPSCGNPGALASAPGGGTLYFADGPDLCDADAQLYIVNPATGGVTPVGPLGFTPSGSWDLNFGPDGNLYYSNNGNLYRLNLSTGAGTPVGSFGGGVEVGILFAADDKLYGFGGIANGPDDVYTINLDTGAATFIQAEPAQFSAATPFAATPEPSGLTLLLLAIGLIGGCALRRRQGFPSVSGDQTKE